MKRFLSIILSLIVIVGLVPFTSYAEVTSLNNVIFTVRSNADSGLSNDVNISFTKNFSSSNYTGVLYLPGKVDVSKLTLSWDEGASVSMGATTCISGETLVPAVNSSENYIVKVGGSSATFTVKTVQGSDCVEAMFMTIDESMGTISAMNSDRNHNTSCYGQIAFTGDTEFFSIKGRGNTTWTDGQKKPYNITIYKKSDYDKKKSVEFIDGVESKKWSLLANYSDGTLLRNKIGYDLAVSLGIGLESRFVDIWMNGEYIGNYLMTAKTDYNAPDGGYMLELDNKKDNEDPQFYLDGIRSESGFENAFTVKNLGDDAEAAGITTDDIKAWMQEMLNAVLDTKSESYLDYIDLDSWAKVYLINELNKNYDILSGSFLMHRDGLTADDKLIAGPVWDLDNSFGRMLQCNTSGLSQEMQFSGGGWYIDSINGKTAFLQFLGMHKSFMERVYELYNEYKDTFEYTKTNLVKQKNLIADSAAMNYTLWDINQYFYNMTKVSRAVTYGSGKYSVSYIKTTTWDDYLANLNTYLTTRLSFLSDNLTVEEFDITGDITGERFDSENITLNVKTDADADSYQWQSSTDGTNWTDVVGGTNKECTIIDIPNTTENFYIRCIVKNSGKVINTTHVAQVTLGTTAIIEPIMLTFGEHEHDYVNGRCTKCWAYDPDCVIFKYLSENKDRGSVTIESEIIDNASTSHIGATAVPTSHYHFVEWEDSDGNKISSNPLTLSIPQDGWKKGISTYEAHFGIDTAIVQFHSNGGDGSMDKQVYPYGIAAKLDENKFTKNNYEFVGWAETEDATSAKYANEQSLTFTPASDGEVKNLYAVWKEKEAILSYSPSSNYGKVKLQSQSSSFSGGTISESVKVGSGQAVGAVAQATTSGYRFKNWTVSGTNRIVSTDMSYVPERVNELYESSDYVANFEKGDYLISYETNGGMLSNTAVMSWAYSSYSFYTSRVILPTESDISKEGYTFDGWYEDETFKDDAITSFSKNEQGDKKFYAKWTPSRNTAYKIIHYKQDVDGNSYSIADTENLTGTTNEMVNVEGHIKTYTGFFENSSSPGKVYEDEISPDGTTVLKIYYDRKRYDVSFDAKGKTGNPANQNIVYEGKATNPNISLDGYYIKWCTKDGTNGDWGEVWNFNTNIVTESITLYAKWYTKVSVPKPNTGLIYNNSVQVGVPEGEGYILTGTYAAANAGSYKAIAKLTAGKEWTDGTTADKQISWSIAKAVPILLVQSADITIPIADPIEIPITYNGDGKLSVSLSNNLAEAKISDDKSKVTITGIKEGKVEVSISGKEGYNYFAPTKQKITVTVKCTHKYKTIYLSNNCSYRHCTRCGINNTYLMSKSYLKKLKLSRGKKSFTAKWSKQTKNNRKKFTGYIIKYSKYNDINSKNVKTVYVKNSNSSKTIKGLSGKTKYHVWIKTYYKKYKYKKWTHKTVVTK